MAACPWTLPATRCWVGPWLRSQLGQAPGVVKWSPWGSLAPPQGAGRPPPQLHCPLSPPWTSGIWGHGGGALSLRAAEAPRAPVAPPDRCRPCSPGQQHGFGNDFASLEKRRCFEGKRLSPPHLGDPPTQKFPSACLYLSLRIRRSVLNFACTWAREPWEPRLQKGGREGRLGKEWLEPRSS